MKENAAFQELKEWIIQFTGLAYYKDKDEDLAERIQRRLRLIGLNDYTTYFAQLQNGKAGESELEELVTELTIGETYFFRYKEQFEALREKIIPAIIKKNLKTRRIRIWNAGCATGEEPYSLAILLKREFGVETNGWEISIVGTDINQKFLARAQEGRFDDWSFREMPPEIKEACFKRSGKSWVINPEYRQMVSFQYHNLVHHPYPSLLHNLSAFDLILCRNVMIYFSRELMQRAIGQFSECLVESGWFLVGHAEPNMEDFRHFQTVGVPGTTLYFKGNAATFEKNIFESLILENDENQALQEFEAPTWTAPMIPEIALLKNQKIAQSKATSPLNLKAVHSLADRGEWELADATCKTFLKKDPLNPLIHFYHALIIEQMGRIQETEESLKRALYLDRNFVLARYHLALLLQKKSDRQGAVREFKNTINTLAQMNRDHVFEDADGMNAADLKELAMMQLETFGECVGG